MSRLIKRLAILIAGLFGLAILATWLLLSSSMLAKTRGDLAAKVLSRELGQTVEITDGVRVDIGRVLHVVTRGLVLPSQAMPTVTLAEIGKLEFDVALRDLLKGRVTLSDLRVDGAELTLVVDKDGTSSWLAAKPADTTDSPATSNNRNVGNFLTDHKIAFSNSGATYRDARNGLEFDLLMTSLELNRKDRSSAVVLSGIGSLNGQDVTITGNLKQKQSFKISAAFSQISVDIDGTQDQTGFAANLSVDIAELGQLLDVLKLEKSISGSGHVKAVFKILDGSAQINDLDVLFTLDGGQSLKVTGDLGKLDDPTDITLDTIVRLYSDKNRPPPTKTRRDLKLIGVDMQLIAQPDGIPQRRMVIETNGFVLDTRGEGPPPISFSEISRTSDGHLRIGKLVLRIGPPEAHFVVLEGAIDDALLLKGINIAGTLALPVGSLIEPEIFQLSEALGHLSGEFQLIGNIDELGLTNLNITSQGTDLLKMDVSGSIKNVLKFSNVALDITASVPSGADFLTALKLEPIKTGPVKFTTKLTSQGTNWTSVTTMTVAQSQLNFDLKLDMNNQNPTVRGQIESDLIKVEQVRDIVAAVLQFSKLSNLHRPSTDTPADSNAIKTTEPLVLPEPGQPTDDTQPPGPFRNVTLHPIGQAILLSGMDLNVTIDLRKIEGEKGSSSLNGDLEMKGHKARFGPLKFEYDGAHFDISGSMDLEESPGILKLSGSTGGWNFGKIMRALRFKKGASGVLYANFDVSGSHASVRAFLTTMNGNATVSMRNGSIDSQLLDLAGLGVIPWLFSKEHGAAVTIVCAVAPLHISKGRISTKRAVIETDRVQIVVLGDVDLKHKTMDIMGQPRRIGKPLSRSPWPFTAVGSFTKPKIKVKDGPRRLRRSDGATTMPKRRKLCVPDILQLK